MGSLPDYGRACIVDRRGHEGKDSAVAVEHREVTKLVGQAGVNPDAWIEGLQLLERRQRGAEASLSFVALATPPGISSSHGVDFPCPRESPCLRRHDGQRKIRRGQSSIPRNDSRGFTSHPTREGLTSAVISTPALSGRRSRSAEAVR